MKGRVPTITTAAGRMIQRRATTGSLTSVFYLQQAGMKEAKTAEKMFIVGIGIPMALLGMGGLYTAIQNGKF